MEVRNRLAEIRRKRGVAAAALAAHAGVTRQTIYAMEAGGYVPNTAVALRLADALDVRVEDLFSLEKAAPATPKTEEVDLLSSEERPLEPGQPVRLCRVGRRLVAVPSPPVPADLPPADAVLVEGAGRAAATVEPLHGDEDNGKRVLVAGCDPGMGVLARHLTREASIELVSASCSSLQALKWLRENKVHIAGSHLRDEASGESNLPVLKTIFPKGGYKVVTFAIWEEGLVVSKGNPKKIRRVADLARRDIILVNREPGAGSRFLLDHRLKQAGVANSAVRGYDRIARGHMPAAWHVYAGLADVCMATRAVARVFGLDFVPLVSERYDLVIPRRYLDLPAVETMLDRLSRSSFQRELSALGGYDVSQTGRVVV